MAHDKILITGGAGMIGSHLIDEVLNESKNCQIIVLDDFSVGPRNNVPFATNIKVVDSSVLDPILLDNLVEQVDIVYHLATLKKGSDAVSSLPTLDTIVGSARVVLEACLKHGVRLVIASTSDVYGYGVRLPFLEDDPISVGPFNSRRWAYAVAKLYTEQLTSLLVWGWMRVLSAILEALAKGRLSLGAVDTCLSLLIMRITELISKYTVMAFKQDV